jgi:outer membrane lipoprotein carrier protein
MKKLLIIIILALFAIHQPAVAQVTQGQVKLMIGQAAASVKSMQCDFVQTKHLKMLGDKVVSRGVMYYQQSDKLRWEYVSPYKYTFILNGNKVQIKNDKRTDVIDVERNKLFKEIARIMMSSVVGDCLNDTRSFKTTITDGNTSWVATLVPQRKEMKQMFSSIRLYFNKKSSMVSMVELVEKNGDKTFIELKNVKTNGQIASSTFAVN